MKKIFKFSFHILVIIFLTIVTQVGGIIYLFTWVISSRMKYGSLKFFGLFIAFYILVSFLIVPFIAPIFGRVPLPFYDKLKPANFAICLLNRHYVTPDLRLQMHEISMKMDNKFPGTNINYLDANFPFFDGFPLVPHLSHNDGKKIDLAFYYRNAETGAIVNSPPSFMGYGIFDGPKKGEINYPKKCAEQGYWHYNFLGWFTPSSNKDKVVVDIERTKELIKLLVDNKLTSKLFIEPHLKKRWNLGNYDKIRFHGCRAVRHDDHIHTQIY